MHFYLSNGVQHWTDAITVASWSLDHFLRYAIAAIQATINPATICRYWSDMAIVDAKSVAIMNSHAFSFLDRMESRYLIIGMKSLTGYLPTDQSPINGGTQPFTQPFPRMPLMSGGDHVDGLSTLPSSR